MAETTTTEKKDAAAPAGAPAKAAPAKAEAKVEGGKPSGSGTAAPKKRDDRRGGGNRRRQGGGNRRREREPREFEQKILDLARVTRVTTGGKRMRFRVALVIGDKKGRVGFGVAKGTDVQLAIQKSFHQAKRNLMTLNLVDGTFPHRQEGQFGAANVLIMPAPKGTGLKSGGAMRMILDLAGVDDAVTKILGSKNKVNVAKATFAALEAMVIPEGTLTDAENSAKLRKEKRSADAKKVVKKPEDKKKPVAKKA
ncbi:MAG TPA: 30S ribosomal protein S5 [Patescibacteria group bacterium]|nr:30S ribosomal protein S5 [Patescibacteria group bacterium]